jgi:hypothetical protein
VLRLVGVADVQIVSFVKSQITIYSWPENEIPSLLWDSLIASYDFSSRGDQIEGSAIKLIAQWAPTLAAFCTSAKSELALLVHIQIFCYEDSRFLKHFRIMVQHLYKLDALSESAILYWYSKGAAPQGKNILISQVEPFVHWLQEQEDESDDE